MELILVEAYSFGAGIEESCEDATVAAVSGAGVGEGGVAFEDGDTEGHWMAGRLSRRVEVQERAEEV